MGTDNTPNLTLVEAFLDLSNRLGETGDVSAVPLSDDVWSTITAVCPQIVITEIGQRGTWPQTNDAIIRFQVQSATEPYVTDERGYQSANMQDVYCVVADYSHRLIVDPDGTTREPDNYGQPMEWASYINIEDEEQRQLEADLIAKAKPSRPGYEYICVEGDTIWKVAQRNNISAQELMEHNDITPEQVVPGFVMRLPYPKNIKSEPTIDYELLPNYRSMHVNKAGGATKYSFGNAKDGIESTGHIFPINYNVKVAAIAHVPVGDTVEDYYMDAAALGDYKKTNEVKWTIGFKAEHLSEGQIERTKPTPLVAEDKLVEQKIKESPERPLPNSYKSTYVPFPDGERTYLFKDKTVVFELDGRRPEKYLTVDDAVTLTGTFTHPDFLNITFGKPKSQYWFAVDMDKVETREERWQREEAAEEAMGVYNTDIPLSDRLVMKEKGKGVKITLPERSLDMLGRAVDGFSKVKKYIRKKKG